MNESEQPHPEAPQKVPVVVETPYRGSDRAPRALHVEYAKACMLDSLRRGEAPFLSHLLYTQVLDDDDPLERKHGIEAGLIIGDMFPKRVIYVDMGLSEGMRSGLERANEQGQEVVFRSLFGDVPAGPAFVDKQPSPER